MKTPLAILLLLLALVVSKAEDPNETAKKEERQKSMISVIQRVGCIPKDSPHHLVE